MMRRNNYWSTKARSSIQILKEKTVVPLLWVAGVHGGLFACTDVIQNRSGDGDVKAEGDDLMQALENDCLMVSPTRARSRIVAEANMF